MHTPKCPLIPWLALVPGVGYFWAFEGDGYWRYDIFDTCKSACRVCQVKLELQSRIALCEPGTRSSKGFRHFYFYLRLFLPSLLMFIFQSFIKTWILFSIQMVTQAEESSLVAELLRVQNLFSLFFPLNGLDNDLLSSCHMKDTADNTESSTNKPITSWSSEFIDLSSCLQDSQVTVPTLNGYILILSNGSMCLDY